MSDLQRRRLIRPASLNGSHYLLSLLEQGQRCGLLTDDWITAFQMDCVALLPRLVERSTQGASSSVPVEQGRSLMASVFYAIGLELKACPSPDDAIDALKARPAASLHADGLARIRRRVLVARQMHRHLKHELFETPNVFYRATAVAGIAGFFKLYDPELGAQEIHITADYPVFVPVPDLEGIEFIERYLQHLICENRFLLGFAPDTVHHLLCGAGAGYADTPMNLYEPVLTTALGCVITHRPIRELRLDPFAQDELRHALGGLAPAWMTTALGKALDALLKTFPCTGSLKAYLKASLPGIAARVNAAAATGHLEKAFPTIAYPEGQPQFTLSYGTRMDHRAFAGLMKTIRACDTAEEKADAITGDIRSFIDLLEILQDCGLDSDELTVVLNRLPLAAVAALIKHFPSDEFLSRDGEMDLYAALHQFQEALPPDTKRQLDRAVELIRFE